MKHLMYSTHSQEYYMTLKTVHSTLTNAQIHVILGLNVFLDLIYLRRTHLTLNKGNTHKYVKVTFFRMKKKNKLIGTNT